MTYVFRVGALVAKVIPTSHRSFADVHLEHRVVNEVRAAGVNTPEWLGVYRTEHATVVLTLFVPDIGGALRWYALGRVAAQLHTVVVPEWLPTWAPRTELYRTRLGSLRTDNVISAAEHDTLNTLIAAVGDMWDNVCTEPYTQVLTHGDLHTGNVITTSQGLVLLDWENAAAGLCEVDSSGALLRTRRFGLGTLDSAAFAQGYGSVTSDSDLTEFLDQLSVLSGVTYLLGSPPGPQHNEGRRRLADVMSDQHITRWVDV